MSQLVGNLLQRPDGVRHALSFFIVEDEKHFSDPSRRITETHALFALGPGLAGHAGLVHGGMIMTLFDEGIARIIEVNWAGNKKFILNRGIIYTAAINIKFKRPPPIDSEVCVTATLLEHDDRLLTIVAEMRGPKRELYATAEALWRNPKPKASL
ncbi:hypothetical protein K4F52_009279 [Lecanicillium sp. MT-2017a]|nr:hypothetical protein K4F52_009279 [Lecanicillium sp. MT-2017a]